MPESLILARELFSACTDQGYKQRRVEFAPKNSEFESFSSNFLYATDGDNVQILIFKKTTIAIFTECHPVMKAYLERRFITTEQASNDLLNDRKSLIRLYYTTVALLLTTHENHSAINLHHEIVNKILDSEDSFFVDLLLDPKTFIIKELYLLQSLLNSNNNKLNKSSSLWTLFKKLFIHCVENEKIFQKLPQNFFLNTAIKAAELHFSNYYAWNLIRFMFNVSKLSLNCSKHCVIFDQIKSFAYSHHTDASAWSSFTDCITISKEGLQHTCFEFNQTSKNSKLQPGSLNLLVMGPSSKDQLLSLSAWLWKNEVVSEVPYHAFRRLLMYNVKVWHEKDLILQLAGQVKIHCSLFEELKFKPKGVEVYPFRGYLKTNVDISNDYELGQVLKIYFNWKNVLDWFDEFIKDKYITIRPLSD